MTIEEAAREYAKTSFTRPYSDTPEEVITIIEPEKCAGFIAGAKWQKEQMMKEAVDATVHLEPGANPVIEIGVGKFGLKVRDKVKVIIVKED